MTDPLLRPGTPGELDVTDFDFESKQTPAVPLRYNNSICSFDQIQFVDSVKYDLRLYLYLFPQRSRISALYRKPRSGRKQGDLTVANVSTPLYVDPQIRFAFVTNPICICDQSDLRLVTNPICISWRIVMCALPRADYTNYTKQLMATPRGPAKEPNNDLSDVQVLHKYDL